MDPEGAACLLSLVHAYGNPRLRWLNLEHISEVPVSSFKLIT